MPKRRFLRYGLRTFLAVIAVLAVLLGRYMYRVNQQKAAVAWVEANARWCGSSVAWTSALS